MKTKPFNLQAALKGAPVVTRDGRSVSQFVEFMDTVSLYTLAAVVDGVPRFFTRSGDFLVSGIENDYDLFMVVNERTVYVNLYKSRLPSAAMYGDFTLYTTQDEADRAASSDRLGGKAVPITIKE